jgi:hypothetical protein
MRCAKPDTPDEDPAGVSASLDPGDADADRCDASRCRRERDRSSRERRPDGRMRGRADRIQARSAAARTRSPERGSLSAVFPTRAPELESRPEESGVVRSASEPCFGRCSRDRWKRGCVAKKRGPTPASVRPRLARPFGSCAASQTASTLRHICTPLSRTTPAASVKVHW